MPEPETDTRPRVATTKAVNLAQLTEELGGVALAASDTEVVVADPASPVTASALASAIDAHAPVPDYGVPDEDRQLRLLRAKARDVAAGNGTFTPDQVQKILARLILRATR